MTLQSQNQSTSQNDISSRSGVLSLPSAVITPAELDTIEAELKERPTKQDKIAIVVSILSSGVVCVKILATTDWFKSNYEIGMLMFSILLCGVQIQRFCASFKTKDSQHHLNAQTYLANLRKAFIQK